MTAERDRITSMIHSEDPFQGYTPEYDEDLQGWNSDSLAFDKAFERTGPKTIIDVGVWKGGSTLALARRLKDQAIDGVVIAVDTFLGSSEHWIPHQFGDYRKDLRIRHGSPQLYWQFLSNVARAGMQDYILPFQQTSSNAADILSELSITADLIHIDAGHDEKSVTDDLERYWPILKIQGTMVIDDYCDEWPSVVAAVDKFASSRRCSIETINPKSIIIKNQINL
jgi:hypothetical protein